MTINKVNIIQYPVGQNEYHPPWNRQDTISLVPSTRFAKQSHWAEGMTYLYNSRMFAAKLYLT